VLDVTGVSGFLIVFGVGARARDTRCVNSGGRLPNCVSARAYQSRTAGACWASHSNSRRYGASRWARVGADRRRAGRESAAVGGCLRTGSGGSKGGT
jgi:hypothetical protein